MSVGGYLPVADTLIDKSRVFRPPIDRWCDRLAAAAERAAALDGGARVETGTTLLNNAALLFASIGDLAEAHALCDLQMRWLGGLCATEDADAMATFAIAPWVNIGRLRRIEGDLDGARAQFAVFAPRGDDVVAFGGFALPFARICYPNAELLYACDLLKTYIQAQDAGQGLRALDQLRAHDHSPVVAAHYAEFELQFRLLARDIDGAAVVVARSELDRRSHEYLVHAMYGCAIVHLMGDACPVRLAKLTHYAQSCLRAAEPDHRDLRFALVLSQLAAAAGERALAETLAGEAVATLARAEDVPLQAQLTALLGCSDASGWRRAAAQVLGENGYTLQAGRMGVKSPLAPRTMAAAAALRDQLHALF
jgi:hypothetical protein